MMMREPSLKRAVLAATAMVAVVGVVKTAQAQFVAPTCVPPNCNPAVIQNIDVAATGQNASINVTGSSRFGGTLQAGTAGPALTTAGQNLMYGNVGAGTTNGSLLLLQNNGSDRFRVGITGDTSIQGVFTVPVGSVGTPSITYSGDTNTGFYWTAADSIGITTGGAQRLTVSNAGTALATGALTVPNGTAGAAAYGFNGDTDTGLYHSAADVLNFSTGGVNRMTVSSTGTVVVSNALQVNGPIIGQFGGDGGSLTNINANNITSGTLNDARLSSNVALLNRSGQTFTGTNNFGSLTSFSAAAGPVMTIANSTGGVEINGTSENAFNLYTEGSMYQRIDSDNDSTNAYYWVAGDNSTVMSLDESGTLDVEHMVMFGGPGVRLLNPGENLIYGNVDQFAGGYIMLLQAESADRFSVDPDGNVVTTGSITSGGELVCLQNGANCPQSVGGFGSPNSLAKFDSSGFILQSSQVYDDGATVGIGGAPVGGQAVTVYGNVSATSFDGIRANITATGAGSTAIYGTGTGANSTGVNGYGLGYGVYGSSVAGYGVHGVSTTAGAGGRGVSGYTYGSGPGVYGDSAGGWGGQFTSLNVTGATSFGGGVTVAADAKLTLGSAASDTGSTNGMMYYNTTSARFRCYENGAWRDCIGSANGTLNRIAKFTPSGSSIGNSLISDDGTSVSWASPATTQTSLAVTNNSLTSGSGAIFSSTAARASGSLLQLTDSGATGSSSRMLNIESTNGSANSDALIRMRAAHGNTNRVMMYLSTDEVSVSDPLGGSDKFLLYSSGSVDMKGNLSVLGTTSLGNNTADSLTISGNAVTTPNGLNFDANTLVLDATNNRVGIGANSSGATLAVTGTFSTTGNNTLGDGVTDRTTVNGELVLGSGATNPTGVNGMMYYNSLNNKFRCYENGTWLNCGSEDDTLQTVTARGATAYTNVAIDVNGGGTVMGGEALTIEGGGVGIYSSAVNYGVQGNATGMSGIGIWGAGQQYGGYFGTSSSGGYALRADAFSANNIAIYNQGRFQVTQQAGFGGEVPAANTGITTRGNYGIVSYGSGAAINYGSYMYGSGGATANYGVAAYGLGGTNAYGVMGYAASGTNNYAFFASSGSMRTVCTTSDSETDSIVCEDIAEVYAAGEKMEPGDVVAWRPEVDNKVYKSRKAYDPGITGIYSTSPGVLMGNTDSEGRYGVEIGNANTEATIERMGDKQAPVALAGRVPVKVTLEGGEIKPGDLLTSASKPGYAMKAGKTGRVVCMAMESFNASSEGEKVLCYVNPHQWVDPQEYDKLKSDIETLKADIKSLKPKR